MREIKFRAWDKENSLMLPSVMFKRITGIDVNTQFACQHSGDCNYCPSCGYKLK